MKNCLVILWLYLTDSSVNMLYQCVFAQETEGIVIAIDIYKLEQLKSKEYFGEIDS